MNRSRSWLGVTLVACGHAGSPGANAKLATQTSLPAISAPASAVPNAPVERPASQLEALQRGEATTGTDGARAHVGALMTDHFVITLLARNAVIEGNLSALRRPVSALADYQYSSALPATWTNSLGQLQRAARLTADASTLDAAASGVSAMSRACGDCHRATCGPSLLQHARYPGQTEANDTLRERMDRHSWAIDQMWIGLTSPSEQAWRDGAAALAETPLTMKGADIAERGDWYEALRDLRQIGARAGDAQGPGEQEDLYGRALALCAQCHSLEK